MKRESLYLQGGLAFIAGTRKRKQPATEENKVRLREDAEVRSRHGESSTGLALLNHPSKRVESPFRLAAEVRCRTGISGWQPALPRGRCIVTLASSVSRDAYCGSGDDTVPAQFSMRAGIQYALN